MAPGPSVLTFLASSESRLLVESLLKAHGFGVQHGNPHFPPLPLIRLHSPDLVLVDMDIPEVSGMELVCRIRKDPLYSDLVIVGLGKDEGDGIDKVAVVAGCTGFIHYPLTSRSFGPQLEGFLGGDRVELGRDEHLQFYRLFAEALIARLENRLEALEEKNLALVGERERQKALTLQILTSLATLIETKDTYTQGHSVQVTAFALALGKKAGLTGENLQILERASLMHDIGKIAIDLAQIHKPGPLSQAEKIRVDQHTEFGFKILSPIDFLEDEAQVVRNHHRRFESYGEHPEIPWRIRKLASIITVADSYDAMVSRRTYNRPLSRAEARAELVRCSGTQFDPALVQAFLEILDESGGSEFEGSAPAALDSPTPA